MKIRSKYLVIISLVGIIGFSVFILFYYNNYSSNFLTGPPFDPAPEEYTFSSFISDKRDIEMGHVTKEGNLILSLVTKKEYGCASYFIVLEKSIKGDVAEIKILGIAHPKDWCFEAIRPAGAVIDLGQPRSLELSFALAGKKDVYHVKFEEGLISVEPIAGLFTTYKTSQYAH